MNAAPLAPTAFRARDLTPGDRAEVVNQLSLGLQGEVRADSWNRWLYATDASLYQMEPVCVVFPKSPEDVQHVLRVAAKARVPVMPRGGGTGLSGQTVNHAIVMDFTRYMSKLLEVNVEESWIRAQPGAVLAEINKQIARDGLLYGIDPSTQNRATIGGGVGNNSCGAHSIVYGKTIDNVLSLNTVLADASLSTFSALDGTDLQRKLDLPGLEGSLYRELRRIGVEQHEEIERRFPKIMRRVSGYNLDDFVNDTGPMDVARMIVGSEGTLAVVTEAKLRVHPLPKTKGLAAAHFHTLVETAEATVAALEHPVASIEMIDSVVVERCRASVGFKHLANFVEGTPGGILLVEMTGDSEAEVRGKLDALKADLERKGLGYYTFVTTEAAAQRDIWRMREAGQGLITSGRGALKAATFVEDAAVAPEKLPEYVRRFQEIVSSNGTEAAYYGHASVGCLHIRPMVNPKTSAGLDQMEKIANEVADLVLEFGGSLSGEHGDGIVRGVFTEKMFGPTLTNAFREVKQTFDPDGLLNPGKIIDTPGFRENLRLPPDVKTWEPATFLDWTFEGGLAAAADQCNGQGACRKHEGGMCPSYMVTLEEEHSTRGRANLLRLVMSGAIPREELTGDGIHDALDLCVECKACAAECPTGVDMAKIKYEVLAQRNKEHGVPLRARVFAHIALLSKLTSPFANIANRVSAFAPARALMSKVIGFAPRRPLPAFAAQTFNKWFSERPLAEGYSNKGVRGEIVLFADTFTDYYHPEVGEAAVRILEALGYTVVVTRRTACCGRPAISKGLLPTAKRWAARNVEALRPYAERGVPIIGTEPSCLLTFRHEYPELLTGEAVKTVAKQSFMLDEFILDLAKREPDAVKAIFKDDRTLNVLLHAHCHQKASIGADPTLQALRLVPGYTATLVDTSCCGMAGSFGFEAEHYDVSKAMGSMRLFPAVEAATTDTAIAITGVSCRQQIGHFTTREPRHAMEILADALLD
jgi:FAD/FMN-containing dehydrogenase/Fe-S oxidoreductase